MTVWEALFLLLAFLAGAGVSGYHAHKAARWRAEAAELSRRVADLGAQLKRCDNVNDCLRLQLLAEIGRVGELLIGISAGRR